MAFLRPVIPRPPSTRAATDQSIAPFSRGPPSSSRRMLGSTMAPTKHFLWHQKVCSVSPARPPFAEKTDKESGSSPFLGTSQPQKQQTATNFLLTPEPPGTSSHPFPGPHFFQNRPGVYQTGRPEHHHRFCTQAGAASPQDPRPPRPPPAPRRPRCR